jgi:hypothetical protein
MPKTTTKPKRPVITYRVTIKAHGYDLVDSEVTVQRTASRTANRLARSWQEHAQRVNVDRYRDGKRERLVHQVRYNPRTKRLIVEEL